MLFVSLSLNNSLTSDWTVCIRAYKKEGTWKKENALHRPKYHLVVRIIIFSIAKWKKIVSVLSSMTENDSGPPVIATTQASIGKMSSMTLKNRLLNCCKSIFVNEYPKLEQEWMRG